MPKDTTKYSVETGLHDLDEMKEQLEALRATPEYKNAWFQGPPAAQALADAAGIMEGLKAGQGAEHIAKHLESPDQEPAEDPAVILYRMRQALEDPNTANAGHKFTSTESEHQARFGRALLASAGTEPELEKLRAITIAQMDLTAEFKPENIYETTQGPDRQLRSELAHAFSKILQESYRPTNPALDYEIELTGGEYERQAAGHWREMARIMESLDPNTERIEARWDPYASPAMVEFSKNVAQIADGTIPTDPNLNTLQLWSEHGRSDPATPEMAQLRNFLYETAEHSLANHNPQLAQQAHALARSLEKPATP